MGERSQLDPNIEMDNSVQSCWADKFTALTQKFDWILSFKGWIVKVTVLTQNLTCILSFKGCWMVKVTDIDLNNAVQRYNFQYVANSMFTA